MQKCRILLADDTEIDIMTYTRYLKDDPDYDYECFSTSDGQETIETYLTLQPDCLVLDYKFPDMTGLEVLEKLQELTGINELPVLIISGNGNQKIALQALQLGAQDYSIKCDVSSNGLSLLIQNTILKTKLAEEVKIQKKQLAAQNLELERSNFELSIFANTACNELNRPLKLMLAFFDSLLPNLKPEGIQTLTLLKSTARSMEAYVSGLLDWSTIRYHSPTFEMVDLKSVAQDVIQELTSQKFYFRSAKKITVLGDGSVEGDKEQMRQLIKQLILHVAAISNNDNPIIELNIIPDDSVAQVTLKVCHLNKKQNSVTNDSPCASDFNLLASKIGRSICQIILDEHKGNFKNYNPDIAADSILVTLPTKHSSSISTNQNDFP
jgi:CheY-like chemotaxis protein